MDLYSSFDFDSFDVIRSLSSSKSCGFDNIPTFFLNLAADILARPLALLFESCFALGIFPVKLKIAKIIPVLKKGDRQEISNYRPISISLPEDSPHGRFATEDSSQRRFATQGVRHTITNVTENLSVSVGQTFATVPMRKIRHTTVIGWGRGGRLGREGWG